MKSLIKIYSRYILTACLFILLLVIVNILCLFGSITHYLTTYQRNLATGNMGSIANEITYNSSENNGNPFLSETGLNLIKQNNYVFAFILSPEGDIVWEWNTPTELPSHYNAADISVFSKWYLDDYPVNTWRYDDYLLVCGQPKHSIWKYNIEYPESFMDNLSLYVKYAIIINLLLLFSVILIAGYRFYRSLRPLTQGMDALAKGNEVSLTEKGIIAELCRKLNRTSLILKEQRNSLEKRDNARTEWIAGVSHDIRTPLSMIMGYADGLSTDDRLSMEHRQQAEIIKRQSLTIKKLIEDLNLTSKLEYHMQPLRICPFMPAPFLRSIVADYYNEGLEDSYSINLKICEDFENICIDGDEALLSRTMNNLIGNCIKHNPAGCQISIAATLQSITVCSIHISDNGTGIPEQVIQILEGIHLPSDRSPHIMGLRIARQIILSHNGNFQFSSDRKGILIELPITNDTPYNNHTTPACDR